ncbi:hypothetical protein GOV10_02275 [Candidatus Woesearchaeota archaeon]|nr:hypothetical protein [Candidatus Woesearchaeota archaeon]
MSLEQSHDMIEWFFEEEFIRPVNIENLTEDNVKLVMGILPPRAKTNITKTLPFYLDNTYFRVPKSTKMKYAAMDAHELTHAFTDQHWPQIVAKGKNERERFMHRTLCEGLALYVEATLAPEENQDARSKIMNLMSTNGRVDIDQIKKLLDASESFVDNKREPFMKYPYAIGALLVASQLEEAHDKYEAFDRLVGNMPPIGTWSELIDVETAKIYRK